MPNSLRVQGATSDPGAARRQASRGGHHEHAETQEQVDASTSQDEEHQQQAEPEQGDAEASPAIHPLY